MSLQGHELRFSAFVPFLIYGLCPSEKYQWCCLSTSIIWKRLEYKRVFKNYFSLFFICVEVGKNPHFAEEILFQIIINCQDHSSQPLGSFQIPQKPQRIKDQMFDCSSRSDKDNLLANKAFNTTWSKHDSPLFLISKTCLCYLSHCNKRLRKVHSMLMVAQTWFAICRTAARDWKAQN